MRLQDQMVALFLVFLRNLHTVLHSGCRHLLSQQQCKRASFYPPTLQYLNNCRFTVSFEIGKWKSSNLKKNYFGYSRSFKDLCKFLDWLVNFCPKNSWRFDTTCIEFTDKFGENSMFQIMSLPIHVFLIQGLNNIPKQYISIYLDLLNFSQQNFVTFNVQVLYFFH